MNTDYTKIIDKYYPGGSTLRDIYYRHCRAVADLALALNKRLEHPLDPVMVEGAAMTHDIGIFLCDAPGIHCTGTLPYLAHGIAGAELLRREGAPEEWAAVAENHIGAGLTADEIRGQNLPLPQRDFLPATTLERLVCYADNFYSKSGDMQQKSYERVRRSIERYGSGTVSRFEALTAEFGKP